ncbi:MAG TPA: nuclear transport factor 2 family protein [Thermoanaerobaculia bacterium]|nr:nuclear transport factor 2 family protein [Thermoanaerobaculia bacterium]
MKTFLLFASLALLVDTPAQSPSPAPGPGSEIENLIWLEQQLWEGWKRHDLPAIKKLTAPEYVSISESGTTPWAGIEKTFADYRLDDYGIGPIHVQRASPDVVILSYQAEIRGAVSGKPVSRRVAESSVWVRRAGKWLNIYLHEITIPGKK